MTARVNPTWTRGSERPINGDDSLSHDKGWRALVLARQDLQAQAARDQEAIEQIE